jgi:hypothetical protein
MKILFFGFLFSLSTVAFADTARLHVTTYTDYANSDQSLSTPIVLVVDVKFVEENNLEFYMFERGEDEICFSGPEKAAAKIVDAILSTSTGDAYVYPEKAKVTVNLIKQDVRFEDEAGEHEFTVSVPRCKQR